MTRFSPWIPIVLAALLLPASPVRGQEPVDSIAGPSALRVFLDCKTRCDRQFILTEIDFVNWVRDRFLAQVQVIVTDQNTGGGGNEYIFQFFGLEELEGQDQVLRFVSNDTDTDDEVRRGFTRVLAIGVANYSALLGRVEGIEVRAAENFRAGDTQRLVAGEVDDPWNLWVFNVRGQGFVNGEEFEREFGGSASFTANRTTETWKARISARGFYTNQRVELSDSTLTTEFRSWSLSGGAAYALAENWSLGSTGQVTSESVQNIALGAQWGVGLEYSFFPYEEATFRQVLLFYEVGLIRNEYEEITQFGELEETRPLHRLTYSMDYEQPWGEAGLTLIGSQYLHDTSLYEVRAFGEISFRVSRGFTVFMDGFAALVENQIFLPQSELSDEDILTGRVERGTGFRYGTSAGLRFTFGSIYNNIVNNRYDRGL